MTEDIQAAALTPLELALLDEELFVASDTRMDFEVSTLPGSAGLRMCTTLVRNIQSVSESFRAEVGLSGFTEPVALIGGGLANGLNCLAFVPDQGMVADIVRAAANGAREAGFRPVMLYVPSELVDHCVKALPDPQWEPMGTHSVLLVPGIRDRDGFLGTITDRKVRATWRQDFRDAAEMGMRAVIKETTWEIIRKAGPYLANVAARNGSQEPARLLEWRMQQLLKRPGKMYVALGYKEGREDPFGYAFMRLLGDQLGAFSVGIDDNEDHRRDLYHFLAFAAPLQAALELRADSIDYGVSHPDPKRFRGCVQESLCRVWGNEQANETLGQI